MSTKNEHCPECEKQRINLLNELFPDQLASENSEGWTLTQLQHLKKSIANSKQRQAVVGKCSDEQSGKTSSIGNSLLGLKMDETPSKPDENTPGSPIANRLFGKKMNEV